MGLADDLRTLATLSGIELRRALWPPRLGPPAAALAIAAMVAGASIDSSSPTAPPLASSSAVSGAPADHWRALSHSFGSRTELDEALTAKLAGVGAAAHRAAPRAAPPSDLERQAREVLELAAELARGLFAADAGASDGRVGMFASSEPNPPPWVAFVSEPPAGIPEELAAQGIESLRAKGPAITAIEGLRARGLDDGVVMDLPQDTSQSARAWYSTGPSVTPGGAARRELWIANFLNRRMEMARQAKLIALGVDLGSLEVAPSQVLRVRQSSATQRQELLARRQDFASRLNALIGALSFQLGLYGGALFGFLWLSRHAEGAFDFYAKSARPAWTMGLAMPLGYAIFSWICVSAGLAAGWLGSLAMGGSMTLELVALGSGACLCGALMGSFVENFAMAFSSNPIVRSCASVLPMALFLSLLSARQGIGRAVAMLVGPERQRALAEALSRALGLGSLDSSSLFSMALSALVVALLAGWAIHARIGRFRRARWQNKP